MSEEKEILRKEARRHRSWVEPGSADVEGAAERFFETIRPEQGQVIAGYWPKGREFDVSPILERALKEGFTCTLPVVEDGSLELRFARWDESVPLEEGAFGIMVPAQKEWVEPDIVIVPLLAFDRRGYRIGHGGGYYDATLRALRARKTILAVGAAYAQDAVLFPLPIEDHDEKLDWVITPQGAHYFGD